MYLHFDIFFYFIDFLLQWKIFFFAVALRPNAGHGLLILEVSRSHTTTQHWTSDHLVAETST